MSSALRPIRRVVVQCVALGWAISPANGQDEQTALAQLKADGPPTERSAPVGYSGTNRIAAVMLERDDTSSTSPLILSVAVPKFTDHPTSKFCLRVRSQIKKNDRAIEYSYFQQYRANGARNEPAQVKIEPRSEDLKLALAKSSLLASMFNGKCPLGGNGLIRYFPIGRGKISEMDYSSIAIYYQPKMAPAKLQYVTIRTKDKRTEAECEKSEGNARFWYICRISGNRKHADDEVDVIIREYARPNRGGGKEESRFAVVVPLGSSK